MGNTESVLVQKRLARFRPDERPVIEGVFDALLGGGGGGGGKTVTLEMLQAAMGAVATASMVGRVFRCLCSIDPGAAASGRPARPPGAAASSGFGREQLVVFLADTLRGTAEERAPLVLAMSQQATGPPTATVARGQVEEFLQDLLSSVVQTLAHRGRLQGWRPDRMEDGGGAAVKVLAEQMCSELLTADDGGCDSASLEDWLFRASQASLYLETLVSEGLGVCLSGRAAPPLLPPCRETPWRELRSLLDVPTLLFLAPQLPDGVGAPWRLAFSTRLHGESFTRLLGGLTKRGPTLLLVRDSGGHVFGGFASHSWEVKPQFQGDSRCFLFSASPRLRVYTTTGYNQHFMYLNQNQQTMPNGLGMGGQHGYFGLWLDSEFGVGHSRARPRCTTYGSPQLSAHEDFRVDTVEVWAVGKPPPPPDEEEDEGGKRSILDVDPEVQAMMEMAGKTLHSRGLREPEEEEEEAG